MIKIYEYITVNYSGKYRYIYGPDSDYDGLDDAQFVAKTKSIVNTGICIIYEFAGMTNDRKFVYIPLAGEGYRNGEKFDWEKEFPEYTKSIKWGRA